MLCYMVMVMVDHHNQLHNLFFQFTLVLCKSLWVWLMLESDKERANHWCWRERGTLHLYHSRELICEPNANLPSRAMGQMPLPRVGGGPYKPGGK